MKALKILFSIFAIALTLFAFSGDLETASATTGITMAIGGMFALPSSKPGKLAVEISEKLNDRIAGFGGQREMGGSRQPSGYDGGGSTPLDTKSASKSFKISLTNKTASTYILILNKPSFLTTAAEVAAYAQLDADKTILLTDGTLVNGTDDADLIATSGNSVRKIAHFFKFVERNPTEILQLELNVNDELCYDAKFGVVPASPIINLGTNQEFDLARFVDPKFLNNKKAIISAKDVQFDDQTIVYVEVVGTDKIATTGGKMSLTFVIGSILNPSAAFAQLNS